MAGNTLNAALVAPIPTLSAQVLGLAIEVTAPRPTVSITVTSGGVISASGLRAPVPRCSITAVAGYGLTAAISAPAPRLAATLINPALITSALRAPTALLSSTLYPANLLTIAVAAPAPILVVSGHPEFGTTVAVRAPRPRLEASIGAAIVSTFDTWVLNTRKGVLTEYGPEFAFNSFATFNGVVLACGANGVVVLGTQDNDAGSAITGRFRTGQEAFESSLHKRIPRLYVSGEFAGDMLLRTITDEGGTRTYSLPYNNATGLQQRRVPVGKGPKSRYWQFEFENVGGADFSVNDLMIYPVKLRRRVQ